MSSVGPASTVPMSLRDKGKARQARMILWVSEREVDLKQGYRGAKEL
jgi:hypothetical protein